MRRRWPLLVGLVLIELAVVLLRAPLVGAESVGCPGQEGWTRSTARREDRPSGWDAPPWEARLPRNNGNARQWLYAVAAGWEADGVIYVSGEPGIYRSRDCGATWETPRTYALGGPVDALAWIVRLATAPSGRIYAGTTTTVWVSDTYGATWRESIWLGAALGLGASSADSDTAYVFGWDNRAPSGSHSADRTVQRTLDGGVSWAVVRGPPSERATAGRGTLPRGSALVDSGDPSVVYVVGDGSVKRSTDGAATFEHFGTYDSIYPDLGRAAMSADGSRMWLIAGSRFYVSGDRGVSWQRLPNVPVTSVTSIAASPHDPRVLFVLGRGDELWAYREPAQLVLWQPPDPWPLLAE